MAPISPALGRRQKVECLPLSTARRFERLKEYFINDPDHTALIVAALFYYSCAPPPPHRPLALRCNH